MKKSRVLLIAVFAAISVIAEAQTIEFDLSDYKLPELERHILDLDFHLSGQQNNNKLNSVYAEFFEPQNQSLFSLYNQLNIRYQYYKNSLSHQRNYVLRLGNSLSHSSRNHDTDYKEMNFGMSPYFTANLKNRWFYDQDQKFLAYDLFLNQNYHLTRYQLPGSDVVTRVGRNIFNAQIPIRIGYGRIEPVQDARHAVYLFQELADIGRMTHEKSPDEIVRLATLISELKNERIFDARLRRIFELEVLDSFLLDQDYVLQYDASYFATLADYWDAGGSPNRLSGQSIAFGVIPGFQNENISQSPSSVDTYSRNSYSVRAGGEYHREKPINLTWQNSMQAHTYIGYMETPFFYQEAKLRLLSANAVWMQSLGYYPSTRTHARVGYAIQFSKYYDRADLDNAIMSSDGNIFRGDIFAGVNYYISPQLRLNFIYSMFFIRNSDKSLMIRDLHYDYIIYDSWNNSSSWTNFDDMKRRFGQSLNLSLQYSFF